MKDGKKTAEEKMEKAWAVMEESWDYEEQFFYGDPSSPGYYNPKSTNFYNRRAGSNDEVLQEFDLSGVMPMDHFVEKGLEEIRRRRGKKPQSSQSCRRSLY
jgi:hypothetical protein